MLVADRVQRDAAKAIDIWHTAFTIIMSVMAHMSIFASQSGRDASRVGLLASKPLIKEKRKRPGESLRPILTTPWTPSIFYFSLREYLRAEYSLMAGQNAGARRISLSIRAATLASRVSPFFAPKDFANVKVAFRRKQRAA